MRLCCPDTSFTSFSFFIWKAVVNVEDMGLLVYVYNVL